MVTNTPLHQLRTSIGKRETHKVWHHPREYLEYQETLTSRAGRNTVRAIAFRQKQEAKRRVYKSNMI